MGKPCKGDRTEGGCRKSCAGVTRERDKRRGRDKPGENSKNKGRLEEKHVALRVQIQAVRSTADTTPITKDRRGWGWGGYMVRSEVDTDCGESTPPTSPSSQPPHSCGVREATEVSRALLHGTLSSLPGE